MLAHLSINRKSLIQQQKNNNIFTHYSVGIRIHSKNSPEIFDFLQRNKKKFQVEKTATGFPTYNYSEKSIYVRDKVINRGALNKILVFHRQVAKSDIYKHLNTFTVKHLQEESIEIERSLKYKGFIFNPEKERSFNKVIKIDCNAAYWQTCRYFKVINGQTYRDIVKNCVKPTRLRITGTLGKKITLTDYDLGKKIETYVRKEKKRRVVFQNIYNRIRKFVDELMIWCWEQNPSNVIGYYVDCIWLREFDVELVQKLEKFYKLKIELVDLMLKKNNQGRFILWEASQENAEDDFTPYDTQFKYNEFVSYKKMYNFTTELNNNINLKVKW